MKKWPPPKLCLSEARKLAAHVERERARRLGTEPEEVNAAEIAAEDGAATEKYATQKKRGSKYYRELQATAAVSRRARRAGG
jgi:hypothetical protein